MSDFKQYKRPKDQHILTIRDNGQFSFNTAFARSFNTVEENLSDRRKRSLGDHFTYINIMYCEETETIGFKFHRTPDKDSFVINEFTNSISARCFKRFIEDKVGLDVVGSYKIKTVDGLYVVQL